MKVVTVVGARPQFVKAAAVSRAMKALPDLREIIVHTGQHFDANMSEVFFREMEIPRPDYSLDVNSLSHGAMTGRMLEKIEAVLLLERPDFVLVYGDTNSTLAGALAAKKLHIKLVHVEAGLRSFNMQMPEEVNRILTDRISDILCCPTDIAVENLLREGFGNFPCRIVKTGDVMHDAALYYGQLSAGRSDILRRLGLDRKDFILCTIHRAENTDDLPKLRGIMAAVVEIAEKFPVVLPLHPRTRRKLEDFNIPLTECGRDRSGLIALDPVGYFDMLELIRHSRVVMTDSGGVQKEAFFFAKPCVTLRDETEWVELIAAGCNRLVGSDSRRIVSGLHDALVSRPDFGAALYGNGRAADRIVDLLSGEVEGVGGGCPGRGDG